MSLTIANNITALNAQHNLSVSNNGLSKSIEKLSSGYRINVGADDPSGLVISEQLRSQISGLERAVRNSSEAYNLISIAEGALNEMNEILKKMRELAIHAANNGVTSPEQIEADQAELDSGIQTINRIANSTQYSDQFLLNGSKQLVYDVTTVTNDPTDHALVDQAATRIDQIFKRSGVTMSIGFTGVKSDSQANASNSAQRAYLESDSAYGLCQLSGNIVTAAQKFILTGTAGSKQFSYPEGTNVGQIVADINNSRDSTGVGATLIFASNVRTDLTATGCLVDPDYAAGTAAVGYSGYNNGSYVYSAGDIQIYGADLNNDETAKVAAVTVTPAAAESFIAGYNCDGDAKIYAKVVDAATNSIEYYKDKECTMLIGAGTDAFFAAANNSGIPGQPTQSLDGIFLDITDKAENLDVYEIALIGQRMDNQKDFTTTGADSWADLGNSVMSGVNLGVNTSAEAQIFLKYTPLSYDEVTGAVDSFKVDVFNDSTMNPQYLVASSGECAAGAAPPQTVYVESVSMDNEQDSNLNLTLNIPSEYFSALPTGELTGTISFDNLGIRAYSVDYGSQETIRIQNQEGELFYYYRESSTLEKVMISGETTVQLYGQDAQITINGSSTLTTGLVANTANADFSGSISLNGGTLGLTTVAVAGYETGSLYSKAEALQGIEENESDIAKNERYFDPPSIAVTLPGVTDNTGNNAVVYLDFSDLDASILARIQNLGGGAAVNVTYHDGTPPTLSVDATSMGASMQLATVNVDPTKLYDGFYSTEANMKGLYLQSSVKIDADKSAAADGVAAGGTVVPYAGNRLVEVQTFATNPRGNTTENLNNFLGGMQFQLGNSSGDQDRTVYSVQSMDIANLGRYEYEGVAYTLVDVQGGHVADLSRDPVLAMKIIEQAANDVSGLRARLGAFQSNMLQTNINSLEVAIENITKTESAIRDTDMAAETTEYTKNQILVQAGTAMLTQANSISQNVLSLLQ
jgi:flagellin